MAEDKQILNYTYKKGIEFISPAHFMVKNWVFKQGEENEAILAHYVAEIAEKNGFTATDLHHLYPAILRMLKVQSSWTI